jgi:rhamnogalacturonyl hydrolase YesR
VRREEYRGYDPYDGLSSPIFTLPLLNSSKTIRLVAQQVVKRLPFNVRLLLGIKKGYNPVTLGLALKSVAYLLKLQPDEKESYLKLGEYLLSEIEHSSSKGYSGHCWGYDFDWQARYAAIPAYCPTIVATGIVSNGLFEYYRSTKNSRAFDLCRSAVQFVINDLNRSEVGRTFCFSYSPYDSQKVYNATMKGARLLAQVYSVTGEKGLCEHAENTVRFVVNNQRPDGSWAYSSGDSRTWVDSFHTGYILDCLDEFIKMTGKSEYIPYLEKAFTFYLNNFFVDNKVPKYYSNSIYPIDLTSGGQAILTLARFGRLEMAISVAVYLIEEMQDAEGFFYYRKGRFWKNKISYMRWSNAWMYTALSYLQLRIHDLV